MNWSSKKQAAYKRKRYHRDPEFRARTLADSWLWKVRERARKAAS